MSENQVRNILGEPVKIEVYAYIAWYYPDVLGGSVKFDTRTRELTLWSEPTFIK